jgi:hypothetical protein
VVAGLLMPANPEERPEVGRSGFDAVPPGVGLFVASFISLFLELLLIRWVPSVVRIVAYYANLMLLSSFLGLGCGLLLSRRGFGLRRWFAPALFFLGSFLFAIREVHFQQGSDELRFLFQTGVSTTTLPIACIFTCNALIFAPLGELLGVYFRKLDPLKAYSYDLGGAITGTAVFGLFSYFWFSPIAGLIVVMAAYLIFYCRNTREVLIAAVFFIVGLASVLLSSSDGAAVWSPYSYITLKEGPDGVGRVDAPAKNLGVMQNPPFYVVQVNRDFYMWNGTIDVRRYSKPTARVLSLAEQYLVPHLFRPGAKDVLIVGSGGGVDIEAATLSGATHIDAVEIDPVIIDLGRKYNASGSYQNPRVFVHNTDARGYFKQTAQHYDMVVFGFLDSQSLFSQMSNIRLDGYVYTRESFREAFGLLRQSGLLSVSFFSSGKMWLVDRLVSMVASATGVRPAVYYQPSGQVILLAGKGFARRPPDRFTNFQRVELRSAGTPEALDDWPYLYLRQRAIPLDYLTTIGVLLAVSLLCVVVSSDKLRKGIDLHFFYLGAGFLLLETKSITTISLYFGATWFVSMIVILGVLVMVLLANLVATRMSRFSAALYLPLASAIAFLYIFPTHYVLSWSFPIRLLFSLVVIPLPIFFAGLIFSLTFRDVRDPGFSFGSNLLGAMVGGFVEYLGMITGTQALLLIVLVFYLASFWVQLRSFQGAAVRSF